MPDLQVSVGIAARDALCAAFDSAHHDITAEFFRLSDERVIGSLNAATARGVQVAVEVEGMPDRYDRSAGSQPPGRDTIAELRARLSPEVKLEISNDPLVLLHAKAALVDGCRALIETANQTPGACYSPGNVIVSDTNASDVAAVRAALQSKDAHCGAHFVSGPGAALREQVEPLFATPSDLCVAVEDLSDPAIVAKFEQRQTAGHADRVLVNTHTKVSPTMAHAIHELQSAGVAVRTLRRHYMHEKYIDAGSHVYIGSANLTHNGLDEAREVGIVAAPESFSDGAASLRQVFEQDWSRACSVNLKGRVQQVLEKAA